MQVSGKRNTVKSRDGPAAVIGNICFFKMPLRKREGGKNRFNAESQKTRRNTMCVKPDGKGFCRNFMSCETLLLFYRQP